MSSTCKNGVSQLFFVAAHNVDEGNDLHSTLYDYLMLTAPFPCFQNLGDQNTNEIELGTHHLLHFTNNFTNRYFGL